jgi:K+-sensing histidine kinase KdpD
MLMPKNLSTDEVGPRNVQALIRHISHEIENSLQIIKLEADLSLRDHGEILYPAINRVEHLLSDLRDYFLLTEPNFSAERIDEILDDVVSRLKNGMPHHKVKLRVICKNPLPVVRIDYRQFRKVLKRVIRFSQVLVEDGGEIEIDVRLKDGDGRRQLELTINSSSTAPLRVEEKDVFQPGLRIKNHHVGLGMAVAHRILGHHQSTIVFRKQNPKRASVIILMDLGPKPLGRSTKKRIG